MRSDLNIDEGELKKALGEVATQRKAKLNAEVDAAYGVGVNTVPKGGFWSGGLWIPGEKRPFFQVIDVGCGPGLYTKAIAAALGASGAVIGVDPDPMVKRVECDNGWQIGETPSYNIVQETLEDRSGLHNAYDLALCLEVAEHISIMDITAFVQRLCTLAPILIFSAAAPGQGGDGHINCREKPYWRELFQRYGFQEDPDKTRQLVTFMAGGPHMGWFTQNVMVLTSYGYRNFTTINAEEAPQAERLASFVRDRLPGWLATK